MSDSDTVMYVKDLMQERISDLYNYVMEKRIMRKDRYDVIEINNEYMQFKALGERSETVFWRLWEKYKYKIHPE